MLAALALGALSAAGSIFSGLGARSAAKSQARRQAAIDAANMARDEAISTAYANEMSAVPAYVARDAEVAGFNPVTWLNAGGLAFRENMLSNKWSFFAGHDLSDAKLIPSVGEAIGSGVSSFASAFGTQYRADQKIDFENSALDRQLAAVSARVSSRPGAAQAGMAALSGTGGPLFAAGSVASQRGVGGLSSSPQSDFKIKATQVFPWLPVDKSSPDAAVVSDRYGEWGEDIAGGYNFANDLSLKLTGKSIPRFVQMDMVGGGADMADFFSMDTARNRKFLADYFQPTHGPRVEWNSPFANPYSAPPGMSTGGGF